MLAGQIDREIIDDIDRGRTVPYRLHNTDRSVGAMLSGELARRGDERELRLNFEGSAGQSFGAFLKKGLHFHLNGEANDFIGKGLSGGRISVSRPAADGPEHVLGGNTVLYGATSGELYISGRVGERFCVRNSGAIAVVEGVGDHCCEYMTGGRVAVLGECGRNCAAGMSAGIVYVLDVHGDFDRRCNMDMVELELLENEDDRNELRHMIEEHLKYTGSRTAKALLQDWDASCKRFIKVMPVGYKMLLADDGN